MDKYIGRLLDNRYEILEIIGTGGMAVVYKARCHRLNRLVAIKILKDDYLQDEEFRRRFHSESQAVAMLGHPNIVSVYDVSTSIMADYIVMELIDGITLKQYMEKKGILNWKETLHFAIQIAKALEHAHSRGIVHRDIKPHNVMVLKNGSVKVMDFGIARMMSKGNTLTKEALGSVHYISPEQAKGGRVDNRSDIYSLGVVMYEMMSGRPPYDAESPVSVAIQHINGGAVMPSTLNPNIPGGLEQIIMKAMAHGIDQRYSSATEMLSDMDEFRKDPAMLFEYNIGPVDDVTRLTRPAPVREAAASVTTAERVARRASENQRRQTGSVTGVQKKPSPPAHTEQERQVRRRKAAEVEEKRNRAATVAIITCSLVMVVAIVIFLIVLFGGGTFSPREELSEVPQLIGKQYSALGETYGDFYIQLGEYVYDDTVPEGEVISHNPVAGEKIGKGNVIRVTVSKGPEPTELLVYMQDVIGKTGAQAENILKTMGLKLQLVFDEEFSETVEKGCVIRTNPPKDTPLTEGQQIQVWLSSGPPIKTGAMPNIVGQRKEYAENALRNQNMDLDVTYEEVFHNSVQAGFVIETDPVSGDKISTGDKVTVIVSKGPQMQNMPNVVGMDVNTASKLLVDAGFKQPAIEYAESDTAKDTVIRQSHEKDVEIALTTKITLWISEGPKPTETTLPPEPTPVTRDVVIDLKNTVVGDSAVQVLRGEEVIFDQTVVKDTPSITLSGQTGTGSITYKVRVNDIEGWVEWEQVEIFTENE